MLRYFKLLLKIRLNQRVGDAFVREFQSILKSHSILYSDVSKFKFVLLWFYRRKATFLVANTRIPQLVEFHFFTWNSLFNVWTSGLLTAAAHFHTKIPSPVCNYLQFISFERKHPTNKFTCTIGNCESEFFSLTEFTRTIEIENGKFKRNSWK